MWKEREKLRKECLTISLGKCMCNRFVLGTFSPSDRGLFGNGDSMLLLFLLSFNRSKSFVEVLELCLFPDSSEVDVKRELALSREI